LFISLVSFISQNTMSTLFKTEYFSFKMSGVLAHTDFEIQSY
jgi:hypothetical protein